MRSNTNHHRERILDAWRGISILLVVAYHLFEFRLAWLFQPDGPLPATQHGAWGWIVHQLLRELEYAGPLGVQIFFCISGYIITALMLREHDKNGRISFSAFYVRRLFRIVPPLILMLSATAIFAWLGYIAVSGKSLYLAASFACNVQNQSCGWFTGHTWSVATEEQFYLVWPLLLAIFGVRMTSTIALMMAVFFTLIDQTSMLTVGFIHNGMSGACLAFGALYASSRLFRDLVARFSSGGSIAIAAALLFGAPYVAHGPTLLHIMNALTPLLIICVIFMPYRYRQSLNGWLAVRALAALGLVSYGLYLWQEMFLAQPADYLRPSLLHYAPIGLAFVLFSYFIVEKPLMRVGARVSRRLIDGALEESAGASSAS